MKNLLNTFGSYNPFSTNVAGLMKRMAESIVYQCKSFDNESIIITGRIIPLRR